jgi:transcriptional antiterminator RfaH
MNWYLVNTKTHSEKMAEMNLQRLGVEVFCPLLQQEKIIRRKRQTVVSPLFPGYLFAKFDPAHQYRAVHYATGISKVVMFGATPAKVEEELIDAMKANMFNGFVRIAVQAPFKPGQKVRIQDGPFRGLEAVFECEMSDRQRVAILLQAVAYQARVVVRTEQVTSL